MKAGEPFPAEIAEFGLYWIIQNHPEQQIVCPCPERRFTTLHEAACYLHEHLTAKINHNNRRIAFHPSAVVYDVSTCERWEWSELFEGGYMDDVLTHQELAIRCEELTR